MSEIKFIERGIGNIVHFSKMIDIELWALYLTVWIEFILDY